MKLRDPELLKGYMRQQNITVLHLARYAGCTRQFIYMLLRGERKTCTEQLAVRIEKAFGLLPGTLFVPGDSPVRRQTINSEPSAA